VTGLLIRRADTGGRSLADVRVAGGTVTGIGARLAARPGEEELDARGGAVLPGLCDHHLHLHALAAAARSVRCGPPGITTPGALAAALAAAPADAHGWVRGTGYSEEVAGRLDAAALDALHAQRPVRVQHRSGALWVVNTAGATALGLAHATHPGIERGAGSAPTGRLWRADAWLRGRLPPGEPPGLGPAGAQLARLGITHVTDATPGLDTVAIGAITAAMHSGALPQHVLLLGVPLGWVPQPGAAGPAAGPYKIVLADSGLPTLAGLAGQIRAAHAAGRPVAVHCVTREALALLLAALGAAGTRPGDRVEHAALVPAEAIPRLRELELRVVTQPGFLPGRGDDYLRDLPDSDHADLYRARSLLDGGVPCALSSDAPYGPVDPWAVIAAAVARRTRSGQAAGAAERLTAAQALAGYLAAPGDPGGPPRMLRPGCPADLVVLRTPRAAALAGPDASLVAATVINGKLAYRADSPVPRLVEPPSPGGP
jgi:predicted amidohydrolase YtcJ